MEIIAPQREIVIGVDTHKHLHVAVALDVLGARLGEPTIGADSRRLRRARLMVGAA